MSFQECFNQLPSSEKDAILRIFREWTLSNAQQGGLKINQLTREHFLSCPDLKDILTWMANNLGGFTTIGESFAALKAYLRQQHQTKGGPIQSTPHPRLIGTVSRLLRFQNYLEQNHESMFENTFDIPTFIRNEKLWKPIWSPKIAGIPFRSTGISWFFWNDPDYVSLLVEDQMKLKKSDYIHALGLDRGRSASDKLLLFVFNIDEHLENGFTLHRPTFGDAACNLQFLPPPYNEKRFGLALSASSPASTRLPSAGPANTQYPERMIPEGVVRTEELLLRHIVHYQILD